MPYQEVKAFMTSFMSYYNGVAALDRIPGAVTQEIHAAEFPLIERDDTSITNRAIFKRTTTKNTPSCCITILKTMPEPFGYESIQLKNAIQCNILSAVTVQRQCDCAQLKKKK